MSVSFAEDQNFLALIGERGVAALKAVGQEMRYDAGAFVHRRGDVKPGLSIILDGRVQIGNLTRDGAQSITLECGVGHTFGEITSFISSARTHDVVALEATIILQVKASALKRVLQSHSEVGAGLLQVLSSRLHLALETLEDFRSNAPAGRLAATLLRRSSLASPATTIIVTQSSLAYEIGVSRVTLGKLLKDLERLGAIERDYGAIHILNREALARSRASAEMI